MSKKKKFINSSPFILNTIINNKSINIIKVTKRVYYKDHSLPLSFRKVQDVISIIYRH